MKLTENQSENCRELDEALNYGCQLYLDADGDLLAHVEGIGLLYGKSGWAWGEVPKSCDRPIHPSLYREPVVQDVIRKLGELGEKEFFINSKEESLQIPEWTYHRSWKDFLEWPEQEIEKGAKGLGWDDSGDGVEKPTCCKYLKTTVVSGSPIYKVHVYGGDVLGFDNFQPYEWTEDELFNGVSEETAKKIKGEE